MLFLFSFVFCFKFGIMFKIKLKYDYFIEYNGGFYNVLILREVR